MIYILELYDINNEKIAILRSSLNKYILGEAHNIVLIQEIAGNKELSFILPVILMDGSTEIYNHRWDNLKAEMRVKYTNTDNVVDWFIIKSLDDIHDTSGSLTSNVQTKHISFLLNKRGLDTSIEETDNATNLLAIILANTGWTVGTVDASLNLKIRTIKIDSKTNTLDQLQELSSKFEAYLKFNGDKTVDLRTNIGSNNGVQFRYRKNLKNIKRTVNSENIVTRLFCYGGNDNTGIVGISSVNTNKQSHVQDFSYYINAGLMTTSTQAKITTYDADILAVNNNISNTQAIIASAQLASDSKTSELEIKKIKVDALNQLITENNNKLPLYATGTTEHNNIDAEILKFTNRVSYLTSGGSFALSTGTVSICTGAIIVTGTGTLFIAEELAHYDHISVAGATATILSVQSDTSLTLATAWGTGVVGQILTATIIGYNELQVEINAYNAIVASGTINLNTYLANKTTIENQFFIDLGDYISVGLFQDSNYIASTALYNDGIIILGRISQPQITYEMGILDLSNLTDYSLDKFFLYDNIYVLDSLLGIDITAQITKINKVLDEPWNTTVTIANYINNFDNLFKQISRSADVLNQKQDYWNLAELGLGLNGQITTGTMQGTFDNNVFDISNGTNGTMEMTTSGMVFTSVKNPQHKFRMDGANIAFSTDGGTTWTTIFTFYDDNTDVKVGFNVNYLRGGTIDAGQINIRGGTDNTNFYWNKYGLFAVDATDANKWIKYFKDGIYFTTDNGATYQVVLDYTGLSVYNSSGTLTSLTNAGILQTSGFSFAENCDATHNLRLDFRIDPGTISIRQVLLSFKIQNFRTYESAAASSDLGTKSISTNTSSYTDHEHTYGQLWTSDEAPDDPHAHWVDIDTTWGGGSHQHSIAHSHVIGSHFHNLQFNIYESTASSNLKVYVDGILRLDNGGGGYNTDQNDLDLSAWVITTGNHYIEISTATLGRISAQLFLKSFVGT